MKMLLTVLGLLFALALPVQATENEIVTYVGGTISNLKSGDSGKLEVRSATVLGFASSSGRFAIPFANIDSYEHSQEVAHHLGVLPAIAVGLVKKRRRKHFLRISFHDDGNSPQVVVFEMPKTMPRTVLAILQQRVPQGCKPQALDRCRV